MSRCNAWRLRFARRPDMLSLHLPPRSRRRLAGLLVSAFRPTRFGLLGALAICGVATASCAPGFFAHEPDAPVAVTPSDEPASGIAPTGLGCSPKGCLPDEHARSAEVLDEASGEVPGLPFNVPHPLRDTVSEEIDRLVQTDLQSLGSMSFGTATRGGLLNSVHLPEHERWILVDPPNAWGTTETVSYLVHAVDSVREQFPNSHPLFVGDLSRRRGGYLKPHLSHQSGKDVDISYFYSQNPQWYARAHAGNLDRPRSWALVRTLIAETDVRYIFIDRSVQRLLRSYAEDIGEDRDWLNSVFRGAGPSEPPIIRHEPGHATHLHVRFYNPIAEETARRCYPSLLRHKKLLPMRYNITHRVQSGETLIGLAKRYRTTVRAIQRANAMKGSVIQAKRIYYIPQRGPAGPGQDRPLPPRRVPPPPRPPTDGPIAAR